MVRNNITRWSPHTCGCVVETVAVYDDNNENILEDSKFLLMNHVCNKHLYLASKVIHREDHHQRAARVLGFIEEAKARNTAQVEIALANAKRHHHRRQLVAISRQVADFNNDITEEWKELVSLPHAFDEHIYEQILKENG